MDRPETIAQTTFDSRDGSTVLGGFTFDTRIHDPGRPQALGGGAFVALFARRRPQAVI
jgi:hypothetical protein